MKSAKRILGNKLAHIFGGYGPAKALFSSSGKIPPEAGGWIAALVLTVIVSALLIMMFSPSVAQICVGLLWGLFVGVSFLIFFPPKVLVTIFGGVVGVGISDLASAAEVLKKTGTTIKGITDTLNASLGSDVFIRPVSVWLFLGMIVLCCLPAYGKNTQ